MAYVSKVWVDRQTEYPTRRKLAFDDGTGDKIVTVSREEGQIYEAGDIFDANTMNNMESRIAAGIGEKQNTLIPGNGIRIDQDNVISATGGGGGIEFTKVESGSLVSVNDAADLPVVDLAVEIKAVQSGTGDPSPSNERPISGWSSVGVTRAGKNLFDEANATIYNKLITTQNTWQNNSSAGSFAFRCKKNITYTLNPNNISITIFRVGLLNQDPDTAPNEASVTNVVRNTNDNPITITTLSDTVAIIVQISYSVISIRATNLQIEVGSTATSFEPYTVTTVTIALGQTVYGGELDVTSGVMTITHVKDTFSNLNIIRASNGSFYANIDTKKLTNDGLICSCFKVYNGEDVNGTTILNKNDNSIGQNSTSNRIYIRADSYTTVQDFQTALGSESVVYELATPVTVQLTPTKIETLLGINNIWADSGDILNLEYYTQSASDVRDFIIKDEDVTDDASWSSEKIQDELDAKQDSLTAGDGIEFDGNEISAVLYKELTATLNVFSTSVVFEDASITTNSVIDIYTSKYGFNPETVTAETGRLTITFRQPDEQITVKVRIS